RRQRNMCIRERYAGLLEKPAKERIVYELMKLFDGDFAHLALLKMDEYGILEQIFPFVKELKQVPPNLHHHLNLFEHSIETVRQVGLLYKNSENSVKEHMTKIDFGGFSRLAHLRLACFMHDIGKFSTWTIEEDTGRHRFIKHEDVGAKMCVSYLKNLSFSNKQIDYISYIIKKHMYPTAVVSSPELSEKVMMRFVRKSEDNAIDNILIAQADRLSARGPEITDDIVEENISALNKLLKFHLEVRETLEPLPKLLDGNEIMKLFDIKPSPKLGEIIEALKEAQISGEIETKDEAITFIKTIL
ncbi:MAG: HD domain-containing protein, partial [Candidatus Gastranaerophilales bacterium]|nr:HD domain-containing protein [Candidatus Gastranaerophilales bacterium]